MHCCKPQNSSRLSLRSVILMQSSFFFFAMLGLSLLWTKSIERGHGLGQLCQWMCENTAKLAGLHGRKGQIAVGMDADLVIFDPESTWTVRSDFYLFFIFSINKAITGVIRSKLDHLRTTFLTRVKRERKTTFV